MYFLKERLIVLCIAVLFKWFMKTIWFKQVSHKKKIKKACDQIVHIGLKFPVSAKLMITNTCNLRCPHCLPESRCDETPSHVRTQAIYNLIRQFHDLGVRQICLTGGEPLLHPDWYHILSFTCGLKNIKRVTLQTNATLLNSDSIQSLCSIGSEELLIQISLEGASPATNDTIRGTGSFNKIVNALEMLSRAGLGRQVVVAFTEMRHNIDELPDVLRLLDDLQIGRLVTGTLVSGGRAAETNQISLPSPEQYKDLIRRYQCDDQFKTRYKKMGNIAAIEWFNGMREAVASCCSCIENLYIDASGNMYPCDMLMIQELAVHHVYRRPLEDTLIDGIELWKHLAAQHHNRRLGLKHCQSCSGKLHCSGGCMGRAYAATGDFMAVEDRCMLRKSVYSWEP